MDAISHLAAPVTLASPRARLDDFEARLTALAANRRCHQLANWNTRTAHAGAVHDGYNVETELAGPGRLAASEETAASTEPSGATP